MGKHIDDGDLLTRRLILTPILMFALAIPLAKMGADALDHYHKMKTDPIYKANVDKENQLRADKFIKWKYFVR